jgi:hypothetical protein
MWEESLAFANNSKCKTGKIFMEIKRYFKIKIS